MPKVSWLINGGVRIRTHAVSPQNLRFIVLVRVFWLQVMENFDSMYLNKKDFIISLSGVWRTFCSVVG